MKNFKVAFLTLLLICGTVVAPVAKAEPPQKQILWTFYNSANDVTILWNAGMGTIAAIDWPGHDVELTGDPSQAAYYPMDDLVYCAGYEMIFDGVPQLLYMTFDRVY